MQLNNLDIRQMIFAKRLKYFEVAQELGITPTTFSRWLQTEINEERKREILKAIKRIK